MDIQSLLANQNFVYAVGLSNGVMQLIKMTDIEKKFERFYPLATFALGSVFGALFGLPLVIGFIAGLTAIGVYSGIKKTVNP